jgi:hypothetical protein
VQPIVPLEPFRDLLAHLATCAQPGCERCAFISDILADLHRAELDPSD